uniref:Uncharacterized protein n=1 Tax=Panagrolaimus sp. ES5 TaxID=591445 RepID=A0AC34FCF6_9BILA
MEVDQNFSDLIYRRVNPKSLEKGLSEALNRQRDDTIDILQVIDWYPYIGVWLLTKEIPNYNIENISLNVICSSNSNLNSVISLIESNIVLSEVPNYEGCRLWFATFVSSFPFTLEINTYEEVVDNAQLTKMPSTHHEMFNYSSEGYLCRKTYFDISAPHITYNNIDFYDPIQIEHAIYFFISLGYHWEIIPLTPNVRGVLNNIVLSNKKFSGDITFPWNWGELISEHQTYVFIPPVEDDDSETLIPFILFGTIPYKYKGALIISKDFDTMVKTQTLLKEIIRNAFPPDLCPPIDDVDDDDSV